MSEEATKDVKSSMNVRSLTRSGDETWTLQQYGERLLSLGGNFLGSEATMFRLAVSGLCIDVLSQDTAKTPLHLRRRTANGYDIVGPKEHPVAALLAGEINPFHNGRYDFVRDLMTHLAISSEVFVAGRRNAQGDLLEACPIQRTRIGNRSVNTENRQWYYDVHPSSNHDKALFGWAQGRQPSSVVSQIRHRALGGDQILSTAALSTGEMSLLEAMQDYQSGSYGNNGIPPLAFAFPDALTDEQFERLTAGFARAVAKARQEGKPVILEGSDGQVPTVHKIAQSATDSEFIKSNMAAANDVTRRFRVPPHKVFLFDSIKYDNLAGAERLYVDDTLKSYFNDIQEGLGKALLTAEERREYDLWFDADKAYAMDPMERQKIASDRWTKGMDEYDEMRRGIGRNAVGGEPGRYRMLSGNFYIVDKDGNVVLRAGGNAPTDDKADDSGDDKTDDKKDEDAKKVLRLVESK